MKQRLAFVFGIILLACPAFAQLDRGMLTGAVVDSSSAGVPAAPMLRNLGANSGYKGGTTELRAEFLNLLNRHTFGGINTTITSPQFGQVPKSGNRTVQLGLRADF